MKDIILTFLLISILSLWVYNGEKIQKLQKDLNSTTVSLNEANDFNEYLLANEMNRQTNISKIYYSMHSKDKELAEIVNIASNEYMLDPLLLTALINSESAFNTNAKHKLDYVKGLGGTNTKYWKYPLDTPEQQIHATAIILRYYLDRHKDIVQALKAYKGWSNKGERQAKYVYSKYLELSEGN